MFDNNLMKIHWTSLHFKFKKNHLMSLVDGKVSGLLDQVLKAKETS